MPVWTPISCVLSRITVVGYLPMPIWTPISFACGSIIARKRHLVSVVGALKLV